MTEAQGWPFLIGAGRRHEYRTLLAPAFLVTAQQYGILDRHATRTPPGESRVVQLGPGLWMAYATHALTDTRDEHNRPLQLLAGFVCSAPIDRLDPADLATALNAGAALYRRYLTTEDNFEVAPSEPFPLRSAPLGSAPLRSTPRRSTASAAPAPSAGPTASAALAPPASRPRPPTRAFVALAVAAALVAAAIALVVVTLSGGNPQQVVCTPASPAVAPGAAPSCA